MIEKKISERKKEKIIYKYISLLNKGYSSFYLKIRFKKYLFALEEYFPVVDRIKSLQRDNINPDFMKKVLYDVFSESAGDDHIVQHETPVKDNKKKFYRVLKPAAIFLSVFTFFSFSFIGAAYASKDSIPGETLYTAKRSIEEIKLFIYPKSQKDELHYLMLINRINETESLFNSNNPEKTAAGNLIKEAEQEFDECKKYNYFGDKSEVEFEYSISKIKEQYRMEFEQDEEGGENDDSVQIKQDKTAINTQESQDEKNIYKQGVESEESSYIELQQKTSVKVEESKKVSYTEMHQETSAEPENEENKSVRESESESDTLSIEDETNQSESD